MIASYKHASLFGLDVIGEEKKVFLALTPGVNVIKLFSFVAHDMPNKLEQTLD